MYTLKYFLLMVMMCMRICALYSQKLEILNVNIKNISETSALIEWTTTLPSSSQIKYGDDPNALFSVLYDVGIQTEHSLSLYGLKKGTKYYFKIVSIISNEQITSPVFEFQLKGIAQLKLIRNEIVKLEKNTAFVAWEYNRPVKNMIHYSESNQQSFLMIENEKVEKNGVFKIKNLKPLTSYQYYLLGQIKDEKIESKINYFKTSEWNIAFNKPVKGTFTNYLRFDTLFDSNTDMLKRVTDNKLNYFTGMAVSGNVNQEEQYVVIELQQEYEIDKVIVYWRALSFSKDYSILISLDNKNWTVLADKIDAYQGLGMRGEKGDPIKYNVLDAQNQVARYVKILVKKDSAFYNKHRDWNFVQLMEVKVYPLR